MSLKIGVWVLACAAVTGAVVNAEDKPPAPSGDDTVFRSDVTLVRVDAQVLDRDNRAVVGLRAEDFALSEAGRPVPIRNFASESLPVDVLLLLDVSVSMRPNIERIASAAHQALGALGETDRVGIMVFDRSSRVRLPFKSDHIVVEREFESLLRHEGFNGGTDIVRGIIDAAKYVGREARREARRAIVIVTDDQTEIKSGFNDYRANRALTNANAVLMALLAPDAMSSGGYGRQHPGGYPGAGGGPGRSGGTWGGGLGGVIIGGGGMGIPGGSRRRGPMGGGGYPPGGSYPGGGPGGSRTESAGTAEIARQSGGDSMPADDASSLETVLARIRQRYALYFYLPQGVKPGEERNIDVELADNSRRRNPGAEVRFRRVYMAPGGLDTNTAPEPAVVAQVPAEPAKATVDQPESTERSERTEPPRLRRRPASDDSITRGSGPDARTRSTDSSGSPPPN